MMTRKSKQNFSDEKSLRIILKTRLFFGLYYKLNSSSNVCVVFKFLCLLIAVSHIVLYYTYTYECETTAIYSVFELAETVARVFISLFTGEEYLMKFSRILYMDLRQTFHVTYKNFAVKLVVLFVVFAEIMTIAFVGVKCRLLDIVGYVTFLHRFMICFSSRLTTIYLFDNYRFSIRLLKKPLIEKWKNANVTNSDKIELIENFLSNYMKVINNLATTLTVTRITVRLCIYFYYFE